MTPEQTFLSALDGHAESSPRPAPRPALHVRVWREPVLQFLAVGAVLFLAAQWVGEGRSGTEQTVVVDAARVQRLAEMFRVQTGTSPLAEETEHLIGTFIRDEILYREALRLGLDKEDEIVRRRLVQKMEFLSSDLVVVPEPTEADLRAIYTRRASGFARPAEATFSHVFFSIDGRSDAAAEMLATRALASATDGSGSVSPAGDPFPLQSSYSGLTEDETRRIFGRSELASAVFSAPEGQWVGPVRSGYGWHLIRIRQREPAFVLPFEEVNAELREAWREEFLQAANEKRLADLRQRYTVIRDVPERQ
jgi:peptidyl-prolyl cis-trans isomerase C